MTLTLYHSTESTCAQKVRFVLSEKGLAWNEIRLNLRKGDQFDPAYLKLNPKAVVPTLLHDDRVIRESTVITEYVDDVFPAPALKPDDLYQRSTMRLIVKAFDDDAHPAIGILSYAIVLRHQMNEMKTAEQLDAHFQKITDPGRRDRQKSTHELGLKSPPAKVAINMFSNVVNLLEASLLDNDWLAGKQFSLADAAAAPYMVRADTLGLSSLWLDKPCVQSWLERAVKRGNSYVLEQPWGSESFREIVKKHAAQALPELNRLIADGQSRQAPSHLKS